MIEEPIWADDFDLRLYKRGFFEKGMAIDGAIRDSSIVVVSKF